jgi:homoserine O-acetyltransferase/O-succinyltransferase
MAEMIKRVPNGKLVLLPISDRSRGHGMHTLPFVWSQCLAELLQESEPDVPAKR